MSSNPRIDAAVEHSDLVRDALALARQAHEKQVRETGSGALPFIDHPLSVAERLAEEGFDDEVLAAALLHDTVEHSDVELPSIEERYGERVAELVSALTENETIEPYQERKDEHRKRVAAAGHEARAIFAADKMANVEVLREAYDMEGEEVDATLPVSLDLKIYVWELDLEMLFNESPGVELVDRFADEMTGLWGQRAAEARASCG
jgi:(p)ppGpp synthase/HD superfamily hydrolase